MPEFGKKLARMGAAERVPDIRHLLDSRDVEACKEAVRNDIRKALVASNAFSENCIDTLLISIMIAPTIDDVLRDERPADRQALMDLHLGIGSGVGNIFASYVLPAKGATAMNAVTSIFSRMQKRFRCLMLRELGRKSENTKNAAEFCFAACPETACDAAWEMEGRDYPMETVPILPLSSCRKADCMCGLTTDTVFDD